MHVVQQMQLQQQRRRLRQRRLLQWQIAIEVQPKGKRHQRKNPNDIEMTFFIYFSRATSFAGGVGVNHPPPTEHHPLSPTPFSVLRNYANFFRLSFFFGKLFCICKMSKNAKNCRH